MGKTVKFSNFWGYQSKKLRKVKIILKDVAYVDEFQIRKTVDEFLIKKA